MSHFICSISTDASGTPTAYALTEKVPGRGELSPSYHVRALNRLDGADPVEKIQDLLADEEQYAGRVTVVAMGGPRAADRFAEAGLSAVPVTVGDRGGEDALRTTEQTLVDTFQAVYRHRTVEMPNEQEEVSAVLSALYNAMSDDAGADEATPEMEALAEEEMNGEGVNLSPEEGPSQEGPSPAVPELSGSSAALSTAKVGGAPGDRTVTVDQAVTATPHRGLEDGRNAGPADLGEHRDLALALALSCWYGEYSADDVPLTDQADETARDAQVRAKRRRQAQDKQNR